MSPASRLVLVTFVRVEAHVPTCLVTTNTALDFAAHLAPSLPTARFIPLPRNSQRPCISRNSPSPRSAEGGVGWIRSKTGRKAQGCCTAYKWSWPGFTHPQLSSSLMTRNTTVFSGEHAEKVRNDRLDMEFCVLLRRIEVGAQRESADSEGCLRLRASWQNDINNGSIRSWEDNYGEFYAL
jgi:hypothetical protein